MKNLILVTVICMAFVGFSSAQILLEPAYLNYTNGKACTQNNNCTSYYCDQGAGVCMSPCAIYQDIGNYSNGCYCENNMQCSSQFCEDRQCKTIDFNDLGFYCNFDSDCKKGGFTGGQVQGIGSRASWSPNAGSDINYYWDCTGKTEGHCGYAKTHGEAVVCDFTKHECQPSCKIGGCFCTENR